MIIIPRYKTMISSFGDFVVEEGEDSLYLVDTSFFNPPNPCKGYDKPSKTSFKGGFFKVYRNVLFERRICEPDKECLSVMDDVELYFREYLDFLKDVVGSGLDMQTTSGVRSEISAQKDIAIRLEKEALSVSQENEKHMFVKRKQQMTKAQTEYTNAVINDVFNAFLGSGIIMTDRMRGDPYYRQIENCLVANSYRWTGKKSKGVDEALLAVGFERASSGRNVIILSYDKDFDKQIRGAYMDRKLYDTRKKAKSSDGNLSVAFLNRNGITKRYVQTRKLQCM